MKISINKRICIKWLITIMAIIIAICHVFWPEVKIDSIFISLLVIALVPWLESLLIELANRDQAVALIWLRVEIEKRLRRLAKVGINSTNKNIFQSLNGLMVNLAKENIISNSELNALKDMINTLNKAVHGVKYDERNAGWIIDKGPSLLKSLDNKMIT